MSYLVLARKWRPKGFDDLIGQEPIMHILKNAISQGRIAHAYLFSGPRGVGKTSTARILAKALNCKDGPTPAPCGACGSCKGITEGSAIDVIEIDGASNNSVDDIRDLREKVKYAPSSGKYKVYIIDEVHMLSGSAFNALLKTLEEPPSHVVFVLATTEMKKIPATVLSRCQHMPFRRISSSEIKTRLKLIIESEGISISSSAISLIARAADGSMRDSLTILDQLSSFSSEINEDSVKGLLGIADIGMLAGISKAVIKGDREAILDTISILTEQGTDIKSFTKELVQFFRNLLVASIIKRPEDYLDLSNEEISGVKDIISLSSDNQLTLMLSEIMKAETEVRNSSAPRLALEMALIRASFLSSMKPIKEIIENIDKYSRHFTGTVPDVPVIKSQIEQKSNISVGEDTKEYTSKAPLPLPTGQTSSSAPSRGEDYSISPPLGGVHTPMAAPQATRDEGEGDAETEENSEDAVKETTESPAISEPLKDPAKDTDISSSWKRAIEKMEAPLASKLSQADFELTGEEFLLTLNGGQALFEDAIKKNLKSIEKILSEEYGKTLRVKLVTMNKKSPGRQDIKEKVMKEPVIKEALELFDGRIVDITPNNINEK